MCARCFRSLEQSGKIFSSFNCESRIYDFAKFAEVTISIKKVTSSELFLLLEKSYLPSQMRSNTVVFWNCSLHLFIHFSQVLSFNLFSLPRAIFLKKMNFFGGSILITILEN